MSCYDMKIQLGVLSSMVAVTVLAGLALGASVVSADDDTHISTATITVPVSCTMSGTGMYSHTATIENGRSEENIGTTTLSAFCNDSGGFAIYAVGYSNNTIGNTYLRDSTLGQTADVSTGTTFSGNNSAWAMKLTKTVDSGDTTGTNAFTIDSDTEGAFTAYHTVPNQYTKVAHKATATDMDSTNGGAKLTTTYKVYISPTQNSGTYIGQVKYTMVHPASEVPAQPVACVGGKICYNANHSSVQGMMGQQTAGNNASVTLLASNFSREGYGFAGWNTSYDYTGTNYGPQETITKPSDFSTNGLSLYARWVKSAGAIQNWTGCSGLASGAVTALTDQRDNQTYAVAKLADGNCWMIENLRLESTNSDNSTGALAQGYGVSSTYGNFSGLANPETANFDNVTTANSLYYSGTQSGTANINIGTAYRPGSRMPRYRNTNTSSRASNPTTGNDAIYSYGNYYTWSAAIADTTYYNTNNQSITTTSLCPAGWRLPRGGNKNNESNNDFWSLIVDGINNGTNPVNYDSETTPSYRGTNGDDASLIMSLRTYPNNFVYSGAAVSSSFNDRGSIGRYWSSTVSSSDNFSVYYLNFGSSYVNPGTSYDKKYYGFTMRCMVGS